MGRKKKRDPPPKFATDSTGHEHFTPFFDDQLNSIAYISLTAVAKEAYMILRQEYRGTRTGNNIICPYSTFIAKGMARNSIPKAINMLETFGFITYESGGLAHQPTVYHFSESWKKLRTKEDIKATKEKLKDREERKNAGKEKMKELALEVAN